MNRRPAEKTQAEKLREVARELECDESADNFDAGLKAVAKDAPAKDKPPSKKKDSQVWRSRRCLGLGFSPNRQFVLIRGCPANPV